MGRATILPAKPHLTVAKADSLLFPRLNGRRLEKERLSTQEVLAR